MNKSDPYHLPKDWYDQAVKKHRHDIWLTVLTMTGAGFIGACCGALLAAGL